MVTNLLCKLLNSPATSKLCKLINNDNYEVQLKYTLGVKQDT